MKPLFLLIITCISLHIKAQTIHFPDPVFKAHLLSLGIDTDNDHDIQVTEAKVVKRLFISGIGPEEEDDFVKTDLTGIEYFTALTFLDCSNNRLSKLNLTQNLLLDTLDCRDNLLTQLDISTLSHLLFLDCTNNQLTHLSPSDHPLLQLFSCRDNRLTQIDVSKNRQLDRFFCSENPIQVLDISQNNKLLMLDCSHNQLTALDLSHAPLLTWLICVYNQISVLEVHHCPNLLWLFCGYNQLTHLDVSRTKVVTFSSGVNTSLKQICINEVQQDSIAKNRPPIGGMWQKDSWSEWDIGCLLTATEQEKEEKEARKTWKVYTIQGSEVPEEQAQNGLFLFVYTDGNRQKVIR